jgi:hypothetical protein
MNKNAKNYLIIASIIITSFLFGNMMTIAQPGNDSNLLEDVWEYIFGVEDEVDALSDDVMILELNLDLLERIHELEIRIAILENCAEECGSNGGSGFPAPDFDSGWQPLTAGGDLTLIHNLGTLEYFVYFMVTEDEPADVTPFNPSSFHNFGTGGAFIEDYTLELMYDTGTYWTATQNTIVIYRYPDDVVSNYGRVMIWITP